VQYQEWRVALKEKNNMAFNLEELQALEVQFDTDAQQLAENFGNEAVSGTGGDDTLIGSASNEAIAGLAGNDTLFGKSGLDTLMGGEGDDQIGSNGGKALLLGNEGNDTLSALTFIDAANDNSTLLGGQGEDTLIGSTKEDLLFGGSEADVLSGDIGSDSLNGGTGDDIVFGGQGEDLVLGDSGDDLVSGDDGNDLVDGGEGNDELLDTQGNDSLTGGEGNDSFVLYPGTDTDTILDFQDGQDKFTLREDFPERVLTFDQLKITESNGSTSISIADTGEVLVELAGVSADAINAEDFTSQTQEELLNAASTGMETSEPTTQSTDYSQELAQSSQLAGQKQNAQPVDNQTEQLAPEEQIGAVTSQGVEAMNVDEARNNFDVDGEGITIGVISDSFDRSLNTDISANDDVLSGDLPGAGNPNGYTKPVNVLDDSVDNSSFLTNDEGRGMLQLIHDVAPGAELAFHQGGHGTDRDLAGAINDLTAAGADIIVDDLGKIDEPFFQDGLSSQAIDNAAAQGVAYFSAVGNYANNSYESEFRAVESEGDSAIPGLEGYTFHDFNPEAEVDIFQGVTLEIGESIDLNFQWDEPFASVGGKGASNDLDIFLLDSEKKIVASSTESNVGKDAVEFLSFSPATDEEAGEYSIAIGQDVTAGGEAPGFIKYIDLSGGTKDAEYFTGSSTAYGHVNATGAESVGAVSYQNTPAFGAETPVLEDFSSLGGTQILFDDQGNRLPEAEIRPQPQITAPDDTNTTFFGNEDTDGDGFLNFSGTSAAAPHAAGVAALLLEANPNATPDQVYQALETSAIDMDSPYTSGSDPGYDTATGYGFIQADRALDEILGTSNTDIASSSSQSAFV
jgi:subtilisin family serine protease